MRIVNIVEIKSGILDNIESFVLLEEDPNDDPSALIKEAEELFMKKAEEHGCKDVDDALENGNWDNNNGYEVLIHWSDEVNL